MAAAVYFVLGRSGSGKSRYLRCRIRALLEAGAAVRCIVPEQFTYETERQLAEEGIAGAPVYSFTTLARQALEEQGNGRVFLSPQGKRMAVRKTLEEMQQSLYAFGRVQNTPGFTQACAQLFTRFKRSEISPEQLAQAAQGLPEGDLLGDKLRDLARLYGETEGYLQGRYLDEEDGFAAFCAALPTSSFAGKHIVLDGIEFKGQQTWRALGLLMDVAASLHIALRLDPNPSRDKGLFAGEARALDRLRAMAGERGCHVQTIALPHPDFPPRFAAPMLAHLEKEAFAFPFFPYGGKSDGSIRLFAALDREGEAAAAAEAVLSAARSGVRYRDMAVIAGDPSYMGPLERAFSARGIPFFSDARHKLTDFAAPRLLMAALRCVSRGFVQNDLLDLMKTGLCGVSRDDWEYLENHLVAWGLRGQSLSRPLGQPDTPPQAEAARQRLMGPLFRLRDALGGASTAAGKTEALFAYMEELDLYGQLQARTAALEAAGELERMEENAQVYAHILTVLDQMHAILGDTPLSTRRYLAIFQEGLNAYEIGAIPATVDQVLLGSLDRTRARDLRALFILGANEGKFPPDTPDDGVIDDAELAQLEALGLPRWENTQELAQAANMDLYGMLTKPRELLYLSYALSAGADAALPAAMVDRVQALFPDLPLETQLAPALPGSDAGGLDALARGLRTLADTGHAPAGLAALYGYYSAQPDHANTLAGLEQALFPALSPAPFGYDLALQLYGGAPGGSATRLEAYNTCPFRHFVQYGLRAQPRREYKERRADEGVFCHQALDGFLQAIRERDPGALDEAQVDELLDGILPPLLAAHNGGVLMDTARGRAKAARLVGAVRATAQAMVAQLKDSGFRPGESEVSFGEGCPYPALTLRLENGAMYKLSGRIDRVDTAQVDAAAYYRVVDYKQGGQAFDYAQLYHGLRLQLPLYVAALEAVHTLAAPAGMYYMPVADPALSEEAAPLKERLQAAFRLQGLTLSDPVLEAAGMLEEGVDTGRGKGLVSRDEFQAVVDFAVDKARDTLGAIMEGGAAVSPARYKQSDPCKTCHYKGICAFDPQLGCRARGLGSMNKDDFLTAIGQKQEDGHAVDK